MICETGNVSKEIEIGTRSQIVFTGRGSVRRWLIYQQCVAARDLRIDQICSRNLNSRIDAGLALTFLPLVNSNTSSHYKAKDRQDQCQFHVPNFGNKPTSESPEDLSYYAE